jgi:hypothetical protein
LSSGKNFCKDNPKISNRKIFFSLLLVTLVKSEEKNKEGWFISCIFAFLIKKVSLSWRTVEKGGGDCRHG